MKITLFGRTFNLPASRLARTVLGVLLIIGGVLGFLPILGFWMIPLGLLVLSVDFPSIRRRRRRIAVWWAKKRNNRPDKKPTADLGGSDRGHSYRD